MKNICIYAVSIISIIGNIGLVSTQSAGEVEMLNLINAERAKANAPPLCLNEYVNNCFIETSYKNITLILYE